MEVEPANFLGTPAAGVELGTVSPPLPFDLIAFIKPEIKVEDCRLGDMASGAQWL